VKIEAGSSLEVIRKNKERADLKEKQIEVREAKKVLRKKEA